MTLTEQQILKLLDLGSSQWSKNSSYKSFLTQKVNKYGFPYVLNTVNSWIGENPRKTSLALKKFLNTI